MIIFLHGVYDNVSDVFPILSNEKAERGVPFRVRDPALRTELATLFVTPQQWVKARPTVLTISWQIVTIKERLTGDIATSELQEEEAYMCQQQNKPRIPAVGGYFVSSGTVNPGDVIVLSELVQRVVVHSNSSK